MEDKKLKAFLIPMTENEKKEFDSKRKAEGLTAQGAMRKAMLSYLKPAEVING